MPPKKSIQKQRSSTKKITSQTVPIYEILSNKSIREPLIDLMPQVETSLKNDPIALKLSFLNMLVRLCGLEEYSSDIQSGNTIEALEDILEKAYEIKKAQATPLILDTKNKFHKDFIKRVKQFLQAVISEQMHVFTDQNVQFNQSFLSWLEILTKSKLRLIRSASIHFTKLLIEEQITLYENFHENRQSKKAFNISKTISYYLQKIVSQRLNDVDQSIRQLAFQTLSLIFQHLEGDILTENLLEKIFTPLFNQDVVILDLSIKTIYKLLQRSKNVKPFIDYLREHLHKFIELSRSTQFTGTNVQALKIIQWLHHQQPTLKILNRDYIVSVMESFAPFNLYYGLHAAVQVFYQSLYKTSEELEANSPIVLLQIINLLMGVTSQKHLNTLLKAFFVSSRKVDSTKIFNIDNMFNLLMSQSYRDQNNTDVKLKQKQVSLLLTIISHWIQHCSQQYIKLIKDKPIYEKILESFNNHILVNCKQLFFQKMTKYQDFSQKYLNIFAHIHTPTLTFSGIESYLDFVCEKAEKLFYENVEQTEVYREIVNILHNLSKDQRLAAKYSAKSLIAKLPFLRLTNQDSELTVDQVYRVSALLSKFPIEELTTSDTFIINLVKTFAQTGNQNQKMQILTIFHFIHHYNFMQLFNNTSQAHQDIYKNARNKVLRLYIQALNNTAEPGSIKLCAFRGLTYLLRVISSKKFEEVKGGRVNAYQLSADDMKIIYEFITGQLFNTDSFDYSSLDITKMLQSMSLETHQIKSEIVRLLFGLYEESYVFTCHPESAKFLITMIKGQYQLNRESVSKSQFLPMSLDLTRQAQKRLNHLLDSYLQEELKQSNQSKLIYWRLCYEIFSQGREDQRFQIILDKLLTSYFSKKKTDTEQRRRLTNKLMIFILHAVDKIIERKDYIQLDVYQNILRKVNRKFQKEVLVRIKEYFIEKTEGAQSNYVKTFLETLESIAKVQIKKPTKKKAANNNSENQDEQSSQSEKQVQNAESEQQGNQQDKDLKTTGKKKGRKPRSKQANRIMEVEQNDSEEVQVPVQEQRNSRSQTKKKLK